MGFSRLFSICLLGLLLVSGTSSAAAGASSFQAWYDVSLRGLHVATLTRVFTLRPDGVYTFESELKAEGMAALVKPIRERELSQGRWLSGRPRPDSYQYEKQSLKKQRLVVLNFDWQAGLVSGQEDGKHWQAPLLAGATDKLVYQLNLMQDLAGEGPLEYRVADDGRIKVQSWERLGSEKIQVGERTFNTVKLQYKGRGDRRTRLWCAGELAFLPVRIEYQEKNGEVTSAVLRPR